jgi:hypothetical protein
MAAFCLSLRFSNSAADNDGKNDGILLMMLLLLG